jgi:chromosome segregation ATPase
MNTNASGFAAGASQPGASNADLLARLETEARRQLESDFEALREREANLQRYEARLRSMQEQIDARASTPASNSSPAAQYNSAPAVVADAELAAAWDKFHRARALLQAEQNQLRDERMAFRDAKADLERREADITTRETRLAERELLFKIAVGSTATVEDGKSPSAVKRLTQAPLHAAKAVFGSPATKPNPA